MPASCSNWRRVTGLAEGAPAFTSSCIRRALGTRELRHLAGDAMDFVDVAIVAEVVLLGVDPLAFPVARIGHGQLDLEYLAAVSELPFLDDLQILAHRHARLDPVMARLQVDGLDHERVAFPMADRVAVVGGHGDVGI